MSKKDYIWVLPGALSLLLLIISATVQPTSFLHGYYVMAVKHWSQGLIPWLGFDLKEMPLGISLLNIIPDIESNQTYARTFILLFSLINTTLLLGVLRKNGVSKHASFWGCSLYIAMQSSFGCLGITLEPIAVTFMLLSYFGITSHQKIKNVFAGIMLAIAVFFKFETILFIPSLALLILFPTHRHHLHVSRTFFFFLIIAFFFLIGYMCITMWSENMDWISSIDINPLNESYHIISWGLFFFNSGISMLLLLAGYIPQKGLTRNLNRSAWFGIFVLILLMLNGCNRSCIQLILPITIIAITMAIQKNWGEKRVKMAYSVCFIAALLSYAAIIAFSPSVEKDNPLLQTFNPNFQMQQEIKSPDYFEINTNIGAGIEDF